MKSVCLILFALLLTACRILPPLPSMPTGSKDAPADEQMFAKLKAYDWNQKPLPATFTDKQVDEIFGKGYFNDFVYEILPYYEYFDLYPRHTIGVRRLFKFYVTQTDFNTGLGVFVHEAVHGYNWIDIFDMDYNEFLSIAGEMWLVEILAEQNPDMAVAQMGRAMSLFSDRNKSYIDEEHVRARLYLGALLEGTDAEEIYKWARDCSKNEFYSRIRTALGDKPRDVVADGLLAFSKRHLPEGYVEALLNSRNQTSAQDRFDTFSQALSQLKSDHVYWDNLQWQVMRSESELDRHDQVLKRAEQIWPQTRQSLLAPAVAHLACLAAYVSSDTATAEVWENRLKVLPEDVTEAWEGRLTRMAFKVRSGMATPEEGLDRLNEFLLKYPSALNGHVKHKFKIRIEFLMTEVCLQAWKRYEKSEQLEPLSSLAIRARQLCETLSVSKKKVLFLLWQAASRAGDRAFLSGDLHKAQKEYATARRFKQQLGPIERFDAVGRYDFETTFWLHELP